MRAVVVDDQELIRRGMRLLLETTEDVEVVGEAPDGAAALDIIARTRPDVVLTDARMPGMDGVALIRALAAVADSPPAIVLTTFDDDELVRGALDAGAAGFLMKDASTEELVAAMRAVLDGGLVIDPRVARSALHRPAADVPADVRTDGARPTASGPSPLAVLTRAETDVAVLVASGATNKEIAERLVLAEGTVKNHVSSLLRKLEQRDRTALALLLSRYVG